jgi:hypothetical protein
MGARDRTQATIYALKCGLAHFDQALDREPSFEKHHSTLQIIAMLDTLFPHTFGVT